MMTVLDWILVVGYWSLIPVVHLLKLWTDKKYRRAIESIPPTPKRSANP